MEQFVDKTSLTFNITPDQFGITSLTNRTGTVTLNYNQLQLLQQQTNQLGQVSFIKELHHSQ
eukprot:UN02956